MTWFKILWGIDLVVLLIALAFFAIGIGDGSVSSFNIMLWLGLLGGLAALVIGSRVLIEKGRRGLGIAVALVPAIPGVLYALFMLVVVLSGERWN